MTDTIKITATVPRGLREAAKRQQAGRAALVVVFEQAREALAQADHYLIAGDIPSARQAIKAADAEFDILARLLGGDFDGAKQLEKHLEGET